jgi:hypothetical protein
VRRARLPLLFSLFALGLTLALAVAVEHTNFALIADQA